MENISDNRIALTRIQKLIGQRMLKSKLTKPCFYIEAKADVTELMGLRPHLRKTCGVKVTTNAFYIRTLAMAAERYPLTAGKLKDDNIVIADSINVGFAVSAPHGLVVPVVKSAEKKTLVETALAEKELIEKARDNKLTLEDMEGESIALSNLGAYDVDSFIGIVPPPASTILAVGYVIASVVLHNGTPAVRKMVSLSLAVDHRIMNGDYAAKFLHHIKELLENPQRVI